jgi:cyclopropane fatty-acyl-phospholipid synthase-like methyltransferase
MSQRDPNDQKLYWEKAGERGYRNEMFNSDDVGEHITQRLWSSALDIGLQLGLTSDAHVLDLGCGDGAFSNRVLARHFRAIDGLDFTEAGISRARAEAPKADVRFEICDLTRADLTQRRHYDGAFLIGILHHVKAVAPSIVNMLREITTRVVVLEPNGSHPLRKLLEQTATYRAAGEDSFRTREVIRMFESAGFRTVIRRPFSIFPNFTPRIIYKSFSAFEAWVESTPILREICTSNIYGFVAEPSPGNSKDE